MSFSDWFKHRHDLKLTPTNLELVFREECDNKDDFEDFMNTLVIEWTLERNLS